MEEGDAIREYKAMYEENVLSSWLREDGREKKRVVVIFLGNTSWINLRTCLIVSRRLGCACGA